MAETPLRQAKNIFIGWATMIGKAAAIPGGLDIEQTYQLIDTYIQECEKMQSEDAIKNLQYNMPIDFARRVAQQKLPANISHEVYPVCSLSIPKSTNPFRQKMSLLFPE